MKTLDASRDPLSGQTHDTEYKEAEATGALKIKESIEESYFRDNGHLTPCSFSTSPYQIFLSPALGLRASNAQKFSNH